MYFQKNTYILCMLLLFITFNSITSNIQLSAEENTPFAYKLSMIDTDADFDESIDLGPAPQVQFVFTTLVTFFGLLLVSRQFPYHFKKTLSIRAPPTS